MSELPYIIRVIVSLLAGYAFGSIPFGFLAGRLKGLDIRTRGSGNIGFTNVLRTIGAGWAVPVLVLDVAKGLGPTAAAPFVGLLPPLVGAGAILGHVFTPWLGFRGGKGVATTIGVCAFICPWSLLAGLGVYAVLLLASGIVSLSSLVFALVLAPLTVLTYPGDYLRLTFAVAVGAVIIVRHRANVRRILNRAEPRLGVWTRLFRRHAE